MPARVLGSGGSSLFNRCLAASVFFHLALFAVLSLRGIMDFFPYTPPIEIELALPYGLSPRAGGSGPGTAAIPVPQAAVRPPRTVPKPAAVAVPMPAPVTVPKPVPQPPSDISMPPPEKTPVKKLPPPPVPVATPVAAATPVSEPAPAAIPAGIPGAPGTRPGTGTGSGPPGAPAGVPSGAGTGPMPDLMPVLLNGEEVLSNLRRFYPEKERRAGREAKVVVKVRIASSGRAETVEILQSAGTAFDEAAKAVVKRMRFSPAMINGRPVAVSLPQLIVFQLK